MNQNLRPKAVTLFSGLGSSSKALADLGYHVLPHDFAPAAVNTLKANEFSDARLADVREIDYTEARYNDTRVLAGGPPCQPFSQSHEGDGQYDPRDMIPEFLRAIDALHPDVFVMEEVQTLTWKKHAAYFAMVVDHMRTLGYDVDYRVLNTGDYFVPQARKRLFVVGIRLDIAERRAEAGLAVRAWPVKSTQVQTMAEALGWTYSTCEARNLQVPDARAHVTHPNEHAAHWPMERPSTTVVGSFRPEVQAAPGYRKAGDPPRQATPGSVVTTLEERLILQQMPTDWVVCGTQAQRDLQVGNSVPCGFFREIVAINTGMVAGR